MNPFAASADGRTIQPVFVECQLALRKKSAVNHTLILEEIQIEISSHFTSLPYEIVRSTSEVVISYPLSPPPSHKRMTVW